MTIRYFTDIEFRSGVLITLGSDAAGDLYCRNQLGLLTRIGIGSNGQLLTALNGLPVWSSDRSPNGAAGGDLSGNYPNPVIANDAITFAKFQNIATQRLLGRTTAGSGDVEDLTAATVRTILALGTAALLNTGVASGNIPVLDSNGKVNNSVISAAAGDLSGSYPSLTIVNDAVTFAKFQNIATQRLLGRNTAGSGAVEELTAATIRTILALGTAALLNTGVASGNVPVVQAIGKLDSSIIPFVPVPLTDVTGTTQALAANNRYYANSASLVTFTLPTTAPQGSIIKIRGVGAGGWRIAQNAGQQIHFGNSSTTAGTGGRLNSTHQRDCVELECVVANTTWQVVNPVGAINVI